MNAQTIIIAANDACAPVAIGQALFAAAHGVSYVYAIEAAPQGVLQLTGAQAFQPVRGTVKAISADGARFSMGLETAERRAAAAADIAPLSPCEVAAIAERADHARDKAAADAESKRAALAIQREEAAALVAQYRPAWAECAIIAEYRINKSDVYTDYFDHETGRTIVLGWSRHRRDLFPEMRKAAAAFEETAALAAAPQSAEHREKYSMGGGYFLKEGTRHSDGWAVKKVDAGSLACAGLEFAPAAMGANIPESPAPVVAETEAAPLSGGFVIEEHTHTKKGFQMWICRMPERVERAEYMRLLDEARELGGWYSKAWAGAPSGFAFKREEAARQFAAEQGGGAPSPTPSGPAPSPAPRKAAPAPKPDANVANKLRDASAAMGSKIEACFRDRETNTPKRSRQAAEARNDGQRWKRAQAIGLALAARHDAGTVPPILASVKSKAALYELAHEAADHSGGYYDASRLLGRPYNWPTDAQREAAAVAWGLLAPASAEDAAAEELRRSVDAVKFSKIEGYFPTPADLVERMMNAADLDGAGHVLEPSAGSGAIADILRDQGHEVQCIERHASLAAILRAKGHTVHHGDFLENIPSPVYDAVLMNPPFERGQDCAHVRHALGYVKAGGSLVAIMGAGVQFREQAPYSTFRAWLEDQGGIMEPIEAGAFKESGTMVSSVMVTIHKGSKA